MNIDFTNCQINKLKWFGGANGNKISVKYKNEDYSVKYNAKVNLVRKGEIRNSVKGENNYE